MTGMMTYPQKGIVEVIWLAIGLFIVASDMIRFASRLKNVHLLHFDHPASLRCDSMSAFIGT